MSFDFSKPTVIRNNTVSSSKLASDHSTRPSVIFHFELVKAFLGYHTLLPFTLIQMTLTPNLIVE